METKDMLEELLSTDMSESEKETIKKIIKELKKHNEQVLKSIEPYEAEVYEELLKSIDEDIYKEILVNDYIKEEYTKYIQAKDGKGFVIKMKHRDLKIIPTYPRRPEKLKALNVYKVDLTKDYAKYAKEKYSERLTRETVMGLLKTNGYVGWHMHFEMTEVGGKIVDNKVVALKKDRYALNNRFIIDLFEALNSQKGIDLVVKYRKHQRSLRTFKGYTNEIYEISDIAKKIVEIKNILIKKKIKIKNEFNFNDYDNSVAYICKKEGWDCFLMTDQNTKFGIMVKDENNVLVYQLARDIEHNPIEEEQGIDEIYFSKDYDYTNEMTYNKRISLEFIDRFPIEVIKSTDAYLLKLENNKHTYGRGALASFGFDVNHTLEVLQEKIEV